MLNRDASRDARMHALWSRVGSGPLEPPFHVELLNHYDPAFRAWGVRAAGNQGKVNRPDQRLALSALANDLWPEVRLQVAIAARKLEGSTPLRLLLDVQQSSSRDPLIARIVWQNLLPRSRTARPSSPNAWKTGRKGPGLEQTHPPHDRAAARQPQGGCARSSPTLLAASSDDDSTVECLRPDSGAIPRPQLAACVRRIAASQDEDRSRVAGPASATVISEYRDHSPGVLRRSGEPEEGARVGAVRSARRSIPRAGTKQKT